MFDDYEESYDDVQSCHFCGCEISKLRRIPVCNQCEKIKGE